MADFDDYGDCTHCSDESGMLRFTPQLEQLPALMDAAQLRQRVISQNLANVNTPGYQRLDVEFEEALAKEVKEQQESGRTGMSEVTAKIVVDESASVRADGNNVDVDRELGQLNKNAMLFQMYSQLLQSQFASMRRAIEAPR
jgi:flagellar basal-body rod protein FlgB